MAETVTIGSKSYLVNIRRSGSSFRLQIDDRDYDGEFSRLNNGSLEIIIEGNEWAVKLFEEVIREGPPLARVDEIQVEVRKPVGDLLEFTIIV